MSTCAKWASDDPFNNLMGTSPKYFRTRLFGVKVKIRNIKSVTDTKTVAN